MYYKLCNSIIIDNDIKNNDIFFIFDIMMKQCKNFSDIYDYLLKYKNYPSEFWLKTNSRGLTVFHQYIWYLCVKVHKFNNIKPLIYWSFLVLFGSYDLKPILNDYTQDMIISMGTLNDPNHTIVHYLYKHNEYSQKLKNIYLNRTLNILLINYSAVLILKDSDNNTPLDYCTTISIDKSINIKNITKKYKTLENDVFNKIESNECNYNLNYSDHLLKMIKLTNDKHDEKQKLLLSCELREEMNDIFNNILCFTNIKIRHEYIVNLYKNNLLVDQFE